MTAEADIKFECSDCGQRLAVDPAGAGLSTTCPICSNLVIVPLASTRHGDARFKARDDGAALLKNSRPQAPERDLPTLREELVQTGLLAGQLERALADAQAESAKLRRQLEGATAERESLATATAQLRKEADRVRAERLALESDLELSRQRLAATEVHLAARERELAGISAEIARTGGEAEAARNESHEMRLECARMQVALDAAHAGLDEAKKLDHDLADACRRITDLTLRLDGIEQARAELSSACEQLRTERAALESDLAASKEGRELLDIRERLSLAEAERGQTAVALRDARADSVRLTASEGTLRADCKALLRRCEEAERKAEAASESRLQKDNDVLRGILARQKEELEQRYSETQRFRRAHLGLRLIYAAISLGIVAVIGLAIKVLPAAL